MASFSIYDTSKPGTTKNFPDASQEHLITIEFHDEAGLLDQYQSFGSIQGYMTKEFEYSCQANYTNIFNNQFGFSNGLVANILRDETQRNIMNYGVLTKKVYMNGESPTLEVSFRCWAGDIEDHPTNFGATNPVTIANGLIGATLPRVASDNIFNATGTTDFFKGLANNTGFEPVRKGLAFVGTAAGATAIKGVNALLPSFGLSTGLTDAVADKVAQDSADSFVKTASNIKLDEFVSKKPPVCHVTIGNIFEKDLMFVKSVNVKFSKEYIWQGVPLYGDFDVSFQSLFNAATLRDVGNSSQQELIFGSGLNGPKSSGRVSFDS